MLALILANTGVTLLTPLIMRDLIDVTIPAGNLNRLIMLAAVLGVMLTLEWRLTLISVVILPLLILAARLLGNRLRDMARKQMESNARMNAMMNETLNI